MPRTRKTRALAVLVAAMTALLVFAVACDDDDDDDNAATPGATRPAATQPAATPPTGATVQPPQPGGVTTIVTRDAGALGTILTTTDGYTLYTFDADVPGSGDSACDAACAANWPPLPVSNPTASSDVTGELGTITRADGSPQVTYNGEPLYLFSGDASPGDTNGDGVGGVWHVVAP